MVDGYTNSLPLSPSPFLYHPNPCLYPLPSLLSPLALTSIPASRLDLSLTGLINLYHDVRVIAVETCMGRWTHMCTRMKPWYSIVEGSLCYRG